jgi:hypothetical protein
VRRALASLVVSGLVVGSASATAEQVPWHSARTADAIEKPNAVWETWEVRAIDSRGRRGLTLRFWTKRNAIGVVWLLYQRGRKPAYGSDGFQAARDRRPGVRMRVPSGQAFVSLRGGRWHLRVGGSSSSGRVDLIVSDHRAGPTIGPLTVHGRPGWLSVLAVGRGRGRISFAGRRFDIRGWRTVVLHEWAEWQPFGGGGSWVRRDLALLWRGSRVDLVWGIDEYQPGPHGWNPNEALWRGVLARIDRPLAVCRARSRHGRVYPGGGVTPTSGMRAGCGGRALGLRWVVEDEMGIAPGGLHHAVTGLATSDRGGVGFLDQSLADT